MKAFAMVVVLAGALVSLTATATAIAAPTGWGRFAVSHARGQYAVVVASGNVNKPRYLAVRVTSYPHQQHKMTVYWDVVCSKGFNAASRSGSFHSTGLGHNKLITHPFTYPDSCTMSADAQLQDDTVGTLYVSLWVRHWR